MRIVESGQWFTKRRLADGIGMLTEPQVDAGLRATMRHGGRGDPFDARRMGEIALDHVREHGG